MHWLKNRAVVHAVIVALFIVPVLGLLCIAPDPDSILGKARLQYDGWEYASVDYRIKHGRTASVNPDIVFLALDAPSMSVSTIVDSQTIAASQPLSLMQSWPFPRETYALICNRLFGAGARAVAFDLWFPATTPNDPAFKAAIDQYRDKIAIGLNFSSDNLRTNDTAHHTGEDVTASDFNSLTLPSASLFPDKDPFDDRLAFLNFFPDSDKVVRNAQYRTNVEKVNGLKGAEKLPALYSLAARMAQKAGEGKIPTDLDSRIMRYAGPPLKTFNNQSYSLYQIFVPKFWDQNFNNGAVFKGKIVLIGPQGQAIKDQLRTPYDDLMDGAEIHLNALNALLQNDFLHPMPDWVAALFVIVVGGLAYLLAMGVASIGIRFAAVVGLQGLYGLLLMWAYNGPGWLLPAIPMGLLLGTTGVGFVYDFLLNQLEKLRLRATFERYSSPNVAKYLLDHSTTYQEMMAGARKPVTALFSDVRGFTTLSEKSDSQELVTKLNEYLTKMVDCVFLHDGSLDKFIGDAVMAVWGNTPYNFGPKGDAVRAVRAARAMMDELRSLNAKWVKEGKTEWKIGIGLNHGEVIVGDVGSAKRKEFAIIGDAVNLASRLESLTKEYHVDILIGESVADLVRDEFHLRTVNLVVVKGKTKAVETFAIVAEKTETLPPDQQKFLTTYEEAVTAFRDRRFTQARDLLNEALKIQPEDTLSIEYLKNCEEFIKNPPDASWIGVQVMTKK